MSIEQEVKIKINSIDKIREALMELGAEIFRKRVFEDNTLFDFEDRRLQMAGKLLRLRKAGNRSTLTYKARVERESSNIKERIEIETLVDSPGHMAIICHGLGMTPRYRYQKYREEFKLYNTIIMIDETPIGNYIEIEGTKEQIHLIALKLGFGKESFITKSYTHLQMEHEGITNINNLTDMLFPGKDK